MLRVLTASLALAAMAVVSCGRPSKETGSLTIVSYGGGAYQQSHKDAFITPFAQISGVTAQSVAWNAEYGKLKSMVESKNVPWDVVEVTDAQFRRGKKDTLYQKLAPGKTEGVFLPNTIDEYGIANVYWGTVMAYDPAAFPNGAPQTWADFWDVKKFPGTRGLYDDPRGNLEFALLADGVPKESLYPLDYERAFKKLGTIKPYIRVWWNEGTQPVQLLQSKSVVLTSAWNGRIFALAREGVKIGYSWNGAALELDWWTIPRGSKNPNTASRFIYFASLPDKMAKQAEQIGYGPVNVTALDHLSDAVKAQLPTYEGNLRVAFVVDAGWWSENEAGMMKRWLTWKASK
jgi:putative spermidine/putrescine transport system substrate-binding protein